MTIASDEERRLRSNSMSVTLITSTGLTEDERAKVRQFCLKSDRYRYTNELDPEKVKILIVPVKR